MFKRTITVLLLVFVCSCVSFAAGGAKPYKKDTKPASKAAKKVSRVGEKIVYEVRLGKVNVGQAMFTHVDKTKFKGRDVNVYTFETKLPRFYDLEKIYSDAVNFLPLRVERQVSGLSSPETITEEYDQEKGTLTIKKRKGKKQVEMFIKKNNVINNAILLPHYVRDAANLKVGYNLIVRLPKQEFIVELVSKEQVCVPAGKFIAYHFVSSPKKFEIWLSADEHRVPLKIKGLSGLGYTLAMKEHNR